MKKIFLIMLILITVLSLGCTTSQPPPATPAYTPPTATQTPTATSPVATPAFDIQFKNFAAYTDGKIKFKAFGKSSYSLSDLRWYVKGEEITDYRKIIVGYQEDIGTANTPILGAAEGEPIYIKTGESWMSGTPVSIKIVEKKSGSPMVDDILLVQSP